MLEQCLDLIKQEQYEAAIECLQPYLEGEETADAFSFMGFCYYNLSKISEAIDWYDRAIKASMDGKHAVASFGKGICYQALEQYEQAIAAYNKTIVLSIDGKCPDASFNKGECYQALEQYWQAINAYNEAIQTSVNKKDAAASYSKGLCYMKLEQYDQEIAAYDDALVVNHHSINPRAYNNKGSRLLALGCYEAALVCFEKAITGSPDEYKPNAWINKAETQLLLSNKVASRQSAFVAIAQDSELAYAFYFISKYFTTHTAYANRVKLFDVAFMRQLQTVNATTVKALPQALRNFADETPMGLYTSLLLHPADLLGTGLDHSARLRQAYLMAAANKEPAWVFYIIDYLLDALEGYALDALDYYFYLTSAQQVAAPLKDLQRIADEAGYTGLSFEAVDEYLHQLATPLPTDGVEACLQNDTEKLLYHQHWLAQQPYTVATTRTELELRYLALALGTIATAEYQSANIHFMNLLDNLQKIGVSIEQVGSSLKALLDTATQEEMLQSMQMITEAEVAGILSAKDANLLKAFALFKFEKVRQHTIKEAQKGGVDLLTTSLGSSAAGHVVGLFVPGYFLYSFAIGLVGTVVTNLLRQPSIDAIAFEWQHFIKLLEEGKDLKEEVGAYVES